MAWVGKPVDKPCRGIRLGLARTLSPCIRRIRWTCRRLPCQPSSASNARNFVTRLLNLGVPIEQVNYLAGHKSMAMTKRYDHANEERYGAAIEALDAAGQTSSSEALAAARWKQTE